MAVEKIDWLETAREIHKLHYERKKADKNWRVRDTATELNRSIGSISENLLIGSWLKTHEVQIKRMRTYKDALDWIRDKKYELSIDDL